TSQPFEPASALSQDDPRPYSSDDWRRRLLDIPDDRDALRAQVGDQYGRLRSAGIAPAVHRAVAAITSTLDPLWLETVAAERGFPAGITPTVAAMLGYPTTAPQNLILLNSFPRTPTVALEVALIRMMGLQRGGLHVHGELRTTAFDPVQARRELQSGRLVRAHVAAGLRMRACLNILRVRPIVIVRNVFDTLASYVGDNYFIALGHRFGDLDRRQQRRILMLRNAVDLVDIYASWSVLAKLNPRALRVDLYEDISQDWVGYTQRVVQERGARVSRAAVEKALEGVPLDAKPPPHGFTADEKALVRELYAQYPTVDFSPIDPGVG
ncbi:MAG: hypothetical protein NXI03_12120, partial [Alphaproteobacteria bacterium]|nr:hypothetical protein [Alphaproteobacteria bacterium]